MQSDQPKHFFDYEVRPGIGEAGTYFYHSHVGFQAVSAAGPLIVKETIGKSPYAYDEERVLFLSEFYNQTGNTIADILTSRPQGWCVDRGVSFVLVLKILQVRRAGSHLDQRSFLCRPGWQKNRGRAPLVKANESYPAMWTRGHRGRTQ